MDAAASKADRILVFKEDHSLGNADLDTGISSHPLIWGVKKGFLNVQLPVTVELELTRSR